ncbi:UDP-N-acetyl-D-mannosamine dehydrogenase [compost metagenome]
MLVRQRLDMKNTRIGILGLSFKEDCRDIRNSKVIDIIRELQDYGISPLVVDPGVDAEEAYKEYGIELSELSSLKDLNVAVVAVAHREFTEMSISDFDRMYSRDNHMKIMVDIKGIYSKSTYEANGYYYWSL